MPRARAAAAKKAPAKSAPKKVAKKAAPAKKPKVAKKAAKKAAPAKKAAAKKTAARKGKKWACSPSLIAPSEWLHFPKTFKLNYTFLSLFPRFHFASINF